MDLRKKKTLRAIREAFFDLRRQKNLEEITVTELANLAQISKATFYLHYRDIFDLSDKLQQEVIQNVLNQIGDPMEIVTDARAFMLKLLHAMESETATIDPLFSGSQAAALPISIVHSLKERIFSQSPDLKNDVKLNVFISYHIHGGYSAYMENIRFWEYQNVVDAIQLLQKP